MNMVVELVVIEVREIVVMLDDVEIIVVAAVVINWEFPVPVSYSVDVLSDVVVDVLIDALSVLAGVIIDVVFGIGVEVLTGVNVNVCAAAMTALVEFPMSTTSEEFCCWAVFDWWPLAVLNCDRVLQAWMPSYHV